MGVNELFVGDDSGSAIWPQWDTRTMKIICWHVVRCKVPNNRGRRRIEEEEEVDRCAKFDGDGDDDDDGR